MSKQALLARVFSVFVGFAALVFFGSTSQVFAQPSSFSMKECYESGTSQQECYTRCIATGRSETLCSGWETSTKANQPEVEAYKKGLEVAIEDPSDVNKAYVDGITSDNLKADLVLAILGGKPIRNEDGSLAYSQGLVGGMGSYMAMMVGNPPATTQVYVADVFNSAGIGIAQPAYAQGLGFSALHPILETWKIFRNIAYFFFVIIILVIGFMIMFRQKIQGQTVVTAQQAIPNIIVALIAVTFSYAIAGLLIDAMYLLMYLMVGLFDVSQVDYIEKDIFQIGVKIFGDSHEVVYTAVENLITQMTNSYDPSTGSGTGVGSILGVFGGLTFLVVFAVALAIGIFKLFFKLLRTYLEIIISIVTSPLVLMLGAIPGKNTFGPWVKNLVGLLMSFPVVLMTLIIFEKLSLNYTSTDTGFLPPYLIGQGSGNAISTLLGLGFILIMADVVEQAQKAMGVTGGGVFGQFGNAISDAVKKGWTGGELVPGVAATNTSRIPFVGSGQDWARKWGTTIGATGYGARGAITGALGSSPAPAGASFRDRYLARRALVFSGARKGADDGGAKSAGLLGEKFLYKDRLKEIKAEKEKKKH